MPHAAFVAAFNSVVSARENKDIFGARRSEDVEP
jgi:hypothetical protein